MNTLTDNTKTTPSAQFLRTLAFVMSLGLIMVIPAEGALFIEGVGRLSRIMGLLTGVVWFVSLIASGQLRKPMLFHYVVAAFVLWNMLSLLWTIDSIRTFDRAKTFAQIGVMVLIFWDLIRTPKEVSCALQAFVFGTYASALGTVYNYWQSSDYFHGRFATAGMHVDDLGILLALGMPIAWYLCLANTAPHTTRIWFKVLNLSYLPLAVLAIFLTGTRGAVVAAMPVVPYVLISLSRFNMTVRVTAIGAGILAGALVIPFIPENSLARISTIGSEVAEGDLNGRVHIWRMGFSSFNENPMLGVGGSSFPVIPENLSHHVAHNSFLSVLFETGLVGFCLMGMIGLMALQSVWSHPPQQRWFWLTLLLVLILGISTLTWEHRKPLWLLLALMQCSSALNPSLMNQRLSPKCPDSSGTPTHQTGGLTYV